MTKEYRYNKAIEILHQNDHNATYDEILKDYNNNIHEAYECLKSTLQQFIEGFTENDTEDCEIIFYKNVLSNLEREVWI